MKKSNFTLLFLLIFTSFLIAQEDGLTLLNSQAIDQKRYEDIRNEPYYFDDWVIANIHTNKGKVIEEVPLNYNGYSKEFEVKKGDRFIELDMRGFSRIEIPAAPNKKVLKSTEESVIVFRPMQPSKFRNNFGIFIYEGEKLQLVQEFRVVVDKKTFNDIGKIREFKAFAKKSNYYIFIGDDYKLIKLKKKQLPKSLEHSKAIETFLKKEKINLDSHDDLRKLFAYYEGLL